MPKLNQAAENGLLTFAIKFLENSRALEDDEEERHNVQHLVAATANAMQQQQQQQGEQEGNTGHIAESDTIVNEQYFKLLRDYDGS